MSCIYDYSTGRITLDFHLMLHGDICELKGIKGKVSCHGCRYCPYNGGFVSDIRSIDWITFTKCKHPEAINSKESGYMLGKIYEKFEEEALIHFYD